MTARSSRIGPAALFVSFAAALLYRLAPNWSQVFEADKVVFQGFDSYFHMRVAENLARNFPWRLGMDPFGLIPGGQNVNTGPLLDYLIASVAWALGLGAPSDRLVDTVGALAPAVLGAAITIPVYGMAKPLFGRMAAVLAAALTAVLPGIFLNYSSVGFTDHHVTESLFFAAALAALFEGLRAETASSRRGVATLLGVALVCVTLNRPGAFFVPALLGLWAVIQFGLDLRDGRERTPAAALLLPAYGLAALAALSVWPLLWADYALLTLVCSAFAVGGADRLAAWAQRRARPTATYVSGLAVCLAAGLTAVAVTAPSRLDFVTGHLAGMLGARPAETVGELYPLFRLNGTFSWMNGFSQFALAGPIAVVALGRLLWRCRRGADPGRTLFAMVAAFMLAATLAQNRYAVYLTPCVAVLTGWAGAAMLAVGERRDRLLAGTALAALVYAPNISLGLESSGQQHGPTPPWRDALGWLREATPEPLGPTAFSAHYPRLPSGATFEHPAGAYGVMSWWDHGYWIQQIAHRIPVTNGTQAGASEAARFYISRSPAGAASILDERRARYVLVDEQAPFQELGQIGGINSRFLAMILWAGASIEEYAEVFYEADDEGRRSPILVFYPAYYESMLARLYLFGGRAATPANSTYVFSYRRQQAPNGFSYRTLQSKVRFETYEKARAYLEARPGQDLVIGGLDPFRTCVPLPALDRFRLVHEAPSPSGAPLPAVRIFEYQGTP